MHETAPQAHNYIIGPILLVTVALAESKNYEYKVITRENSYACRIS